jgi:outer membrane protein
VNTRCLVIIIVAVFASQIIKSQPSQKWTLEKCINYAFDNNLQVRETAVTAKISGTDHLQSKLNLLPTIDMNGSFSDNFGNGFNPQTFSFAQGNSQSLQLQLTGNVPLFTGLQQIYNVERAKFDFLASKFDNANAKNTIALNVASAYLQILLNREIEQVAEKQKALSEDQKNIVLNRIKSGALPETAIYDIEAQIGRDEVNIVGAKNAVDLSVLALEQLLQLHDVKGFDIDAPEVKADNMPDVNTLSSEEIYKYALMNQPSVMGADARVMSANASKKISYGGFSPTLAAFGSLSTGWFSMDKNNVYKDTTVFGYQLPFLVSSTNTSLGQDLRTNFRQVVGLSLDVPLFSKGTKVLNMQKAQLQVQIRQMQLESTKNQLQQDIEQAYANAKASAESYAANNKSLISSQKAYQATTTRYKAGIASNFDIEQAQQNLIAAESEILKAKYTYVFRMKILDFYQGKPITL